ncbi:MAG: trypsin-like serine protease, partial [Candidatus Brocadiia bacterium]
ESIFQGVFSPQNSLISATYSPSFLCLKCADVEQYGIISIIEPDYWEISAPILPGNSGGPVFDARTYEVVGISVWVHTCKEQLVTTMAGIVPIQKIYDFLESVSQEYAGSNSLLTPFGLTASKRGNNVCFK